MIDDTSEWTSRLGQFSISLANSRNTNRSSGIFPSKTCKTQNHHRIQRIIQILACWALYGVKLTRELLRLVNFQTFEYLLKCNGHILLGAATFIFNAKLPSSFHLAWIFYHNCQSDLRSWFQIRFIRLISAYQVLHLTLMIDIHI